MTILPLTCTGPAVSMGEFGRAIRSAAGLRLAEWPLPVGRVVLTHSARVGIALACQAWHLRPGDQALAPAYNCGSEVDALLAAGLDVQLFRVDKQAQPDWDDCRNRVTRRTKVVFITHFFGRPLDLAETGRWCAMRGVRLLEDCAHALFTTRGGEPVGAHADAAVFSLPKTLPVPDGGLLVMQDKADDSVTDLRPAPLRRVFTESLPLLKNALIRRSKALCTCYGLLRARRARAQSRNATAFPDLPASYYFDPGLRQRRMSAVSARLAAACRPAEVVQRRASNYLRLLRQVSHIRGVRPLFDDLPAGVCPLVLPLLVRHRGTICRHLRRHGVEAIPWWAGYHRAFPWAEYPEAVFLKNHVLALPVHQQLGPADIDAIAALLRHVCRTTRKARGGKPRTYPAGSL